jgi:glutamate synthase (NADPH/NADH) large chain
MTDPTPSATSERAVQTQAAALKDAALRGLYDPRREHDACGVGFIAHMKGVKSHQIIRDGLAMLENLTHRGAVGSDPLMGDGAGLLAQIPDRLFREELAKDGITLPPAGHYGVGYLFMPQDPALRAHIEGIIREAALAEGETLLGFRDVPVDNSSLSTAPHIAASEPFHRQVFIGRNPDIASEDEFERRLYILRKVISARIHAETKGVDNGFYTVSMSARTIVYKGMFLAYQVARYY